MAEDTLLSDLCTICFVKKPIYRCPRCRCRTCSVPCYKRHQQRASCNGQRDPTAYLKKSQLATPAGIDHDYNYLKRVERSIDLADSDTALRGIGLDGPHATRTSARAWLPGGALQTYLGENGITVIRAPKGMSRQRENRTRSSNRAKIMWTVEWVDESGDRSVQHDCDASASLTAIHAIFRAERRNAEKRRAEAAEVVPQERSRQDQQQHVDTSARRGEKRKRRAVVDETLQDDGLGSTLDAQKLAAEGSTASTIERAGDVCGNSDREAERQLHAQETFERNAHAVPDETENASRQSDPTGHPQSMDDSNSKPESQSNHSAPAGLPTKEMDANPSPAKVPQEQEPALSTPPDAIACPRASAGEKSGPSFFLLQPSSTKPQRRLIALRGSESLTHSLRGATLQEYPTVYVVNEDSGGASLLGLEVDRSSVRNAVPEKV